MNGRSLLLVIPLFFGGVASATFFPHQPGGLLSGSPLLSPTFGDLPVAFEENRGQTDPRIRFVSRGGGYTVAVTATELTFVRRGSGRTRPGVEWMRLVGANPRAKVSGDGRLPGQACYFRGRDPRGWRTRIPHYSRVRVHSAYPGVDLIYYGAGRHLEFDLCVAPAADLSPVRVRFDGTTKPRVDARGDLLLSGPDRTERYRRPFAYQTIGEKRSRVACEYAIDRTGAVRFRLGKYDRKQPLVIDPVLSYATYLGGSADDAGSAIAVDAQGNAYIAGGTLSLDFPVGNSFGTEKPAPLHTVTKDAFVAKLNPSGTRVLYAAYLGGGSEDAAAGIAVDRAGNAYVTGSTASYFEKGVDLRPNGVDYVTPDKVPFPTTSTAFDTVGKISGAYGFGTDAFLAKISPDGSTLLYSTYLGGDSVDEGAGIAVYNDRIAVVVGETQSRYEKMDYPFDDGSGYGAAEGFPVTPDAVQATYHGRGEGLQGDAFLTRIDTNAAGAASLLYSTYLGGSDSDNANGVALDREGNAYLTGFTASEDFPVTDGAFQMKKQKDDAIVGDGFVAKIGSDGRLAYSTYLGGGGTDWGQSIAVDAAGRAVVTGFTRSSTENVAFPTTPNGFQPQQGDVQRQRLCMDAFATDTDSWVFSVMCSDGFVARLNATGTGLDYASYIGGAKDDRGYAVALDADGGIWIAGKSDGFPPAEGQPPILPGAAMAGFLMKLDAGGALVYATRTAPVPYALALDAAGGVYLTGEAAGMTATAGAAQENSAGGDDAFVAKIGGGPLPADDIGNPPIPPADPRGTPPIPSVESGKLTWLGASSMEGSVGASITVEVGLITPVPAADLSKLALIFSSADGKGVQAAPGDAAVNGDPVSVIDLTANVPAGAITGKMEVVLIVNRNGGSVLLSVVSPEPFQVTGSGGGTPPPATNVPVKLSWIDAQPMRGTAGTTVMATVALDPPVPSDQLSSAVLAFSAAGEKLVLADNLEVRIQGDPVTRLLFTGTVPRDAVSGALVAGLRLTSSPDISTVISPTGFVIGGSLPAPPDSGPTPPSGTRTPGDTNGDGKVNIQDATLALRLAVGLTDATPDRKAAADVNGDGKVDLRDVTRILRQAVGLVSGGAAPLS